MQVAGHGKVERKPSNALEMVGSFFQRTGSAIIEPFTLCAAPRSKLANGRMASIKAEE